MNRKLNHAMAHVVLFAFSISTVPVIGDEPRNRRTPVNDEVLDNPVPEQDVPPPKHWGIFVEKGGYAIPENFDPRLETDSKKHRDTYKIEYPEGYEPKGVTPDWSPRNQFQWDYDNAQNEGLRRAFGSNIGVYVPIRAYDRTIQDTGSHEKAKYMMDFATVMTAQAVEARRTGKPFDHVKARSEFMKTEGWALFKDVGGDVLGEIPVAKAIFKGAVAYADADMKYREQDKTPANGETLSYIMTGDQNALKISSEKEAQVLEQIEMGNMFAGAVLSDAELARIRSTVGTPGIIELNRYIRGLGTFQFAGDPTSENVRSMNPDYANSERLKAVEGVVNWLKNNQQENFAAIRQNQEDLKVQGFAIEFRTTAIGVMLQNFSARSEQAYNELLANDKALLAQGKQTNDTVNAIADYLKKQEENKRKQQRVEEIMSCYDSAEVMLRQFGSITGDKQIQKTANKVADVVKVAKRIQTLVNQAKTFKALSGFGQAAFSMNVASAGMAIIGLFGSAGPDINAEILKAVQDLTKQMHERFDRLEGMLRDINVKLDDRFDELEETLRLISLKLDEANGRLAVLQKDFIQLSDVIASSMDEIRAFQKDTYLNGYDQLVSRTIESRLAHPNETVLRTTFIDSLRDFSHWSSNVPRRSPFVLPVQFEKELGATLDKSLNDYRYFNLNQAFAVDKGYFKIDYPETTSAGTLPDVVSWRRASEGLVDYIFLHPEHASVDSTPELKQALQIGVQVREAIQKARAPERVTKILASELEMTKKLLVETKKIDEAMRARNLVPAGVSAKQWLTVGGAVSKAGSYPFEPGWFRERPVVELKGKKTRLGDSAGLIAPPGLRLLSYIRAANGGPKIHFEATPVLSWKNDREGKRFNPKVATVYHYYPSTSLRLTSDEFEGSVVTGEVRDSKVFYTAHAEYNDSVDPSDFGHNGKQRVGYFSEPRVNVAHLDGWFADNMAAFYDEEQAAEWQNGEAQHKQETLYEWIDQELQAHHDGLWKEFRLALSPDPDSAKTAGVGAFHYLKFEQAAALNAYSASISKIADWRRHNLVLIAPELVEPFEKEFAEWKLNSFLAQATKDETNIDGLVNKLEERSAAMEKWLVDKLQANASDESRFAMVDEVLAKLNGALLAKTRGQEITEKADQLMEQFIR